MERREWTQLFGESLYPRQAIWGLLVYVWDNGSRVPALSHFWGCSTYRAVRKPVREAGCLGWMWEWCLLQCPCFWPLSSWHGLGVSFCGQIGAQVLVAKQSTRTAGMRAGLWLLGSVSDYSHFSISWAGGCCEEDWHQVVPETLM